MIVPAVTAILENSEGKILLQQRDLKPGLPFAGYWSTPGGKVEIGETPLAAMQRELYEELEIQIAVHIWKSCERECRYEDGRIDTKR
jgi:8-oxo-dGTP diphosphatase